MPVLAPNQRARLRVLLAVVFVALLVPAVVLAWLGYRQLQYESFYLHQTMAAELTERIDRQASEILAAEDERSFVDFGFLIVGEGNFVQRSPLSTYPVDGAVPGLVSYFQVDAEGVFSTPLLPGLTPIGEDPTTGALTPDEYEARLALQNRARGLLAGVDSRATGAEEEATAEQDKEGPDRSAQTKEAKKRSAVPVAAYSPEEREAEPASRDDRQQAALVEGQRAFERLNAPKAKADSPLGSVAELQLEERFDRIASGGKAAVESTFGDEVNALEQQFDAPVTKGETAARRLEKSVALAPELARTAPGDPDDLPLAMFESELDPFQFDVLDGEHFVLYRNVWRDQQRFVQGAIIERTAFLEALIGSVFRPTAIAAVSDLVVAHRGEVLNTYRRSSTGERTLGYASRAADITGTLLYRTRLPRPINDIELIFGFTRLPIGPGGALIAWTTSAFLVLLVGGFALLYRLGLRQIALAEQQQDFVSAVSHELKTPLTSIRMYGEILKAGWADEEKKRGYYDFIFAESERLTRLINNVLRLARFDRNGSDLELRSTSVGELVDLARSKITSHVTQAGFELAEGHESLDLELDVDADAFVQIIINLVDNALKFSANAPDKTIAFSSRLRDDSWVEFSVRDYGPGVPKSQMKKIFQLFYRTERELTRETVGTGIGLALVAELAGAMEGSVDVRNAEPGAEFRLRLPLKA